MPLFTIILSALSLELLMSPQEREETGYEALSHEEQTALEHWIEERFIPKSIGKQMTAYLSMNKKGGSEILLDNESNWSIDPKDRIISSLWLSPSPIKISQKGTGEYPYTLTNLHSQKSIRAKRIP